jgi:hypothetical protein
MSANSDNVFSPTNTPARAIVCSPASTFLIPSAQTHLSKQRHVQVPASGKSHVRLRGPSHVEFLRLVTLTLTRFAYLHHARIANEIPEFRDFHPLVMHTDYDASTRCDSPFTGNDRFVIYEDGGRPIDIQLSAGWRPNLAAVARIAQQLLELLAYLHTKQVVHRKLSLGTVVRNERDDIKLISLGEAKYVGPLDYEDHVEAFIEQWQGARDAVGASSCTSSSSPPPRQTPETKNKTTKKYDCADPQSRCSSRSQFLF